MKIRPGTMDKSVLDETYRDVYFARDIVKNGDIVVDCGAYIGTFAKFIFGFAPETRVICLEPMPSNIELLKENLKDEPSYKLISAAVMDSCGTCCIYDFGPRFSACHSIFSLGVKDAKAVHVPSTTLQAVMEKNHLSKIDFLKLDIQGAEYEVIPNTPLFVFEKINYISMEMHKGFYNGMSSLGLIPDYEKKIFRVVSYLSKTHILLRKVGNVYLWKNKRYTSRVERLRGEVKKIHWLLLNLIQYIYKHITPIIPVPVKKIVKRLYHLLDSQKSRGLN